ncbi:MAG: exopolysaccharide biosynthesis polyprenyl glycosylphosphotransferase [Ignavibacteriales bacterium]|nr:exopolysaccharide biosynthesis polyprenyl glycosylphosphotransferase [Ignavibacteriales bacterium]
MIANQKSRYSIKLLPDMLLLNISFLISAMLAQSWQTLMQRPYMFFLLFALNVLWYFVTKRALFYDSIGFHKIYKQIIDVAKSSIVLMLASIIFIFVAKEDLFTRYFIVYNTILLNFAVSLRIIIYGSVERKIRIGEKYLRKLIIIGSGQTAIDFSKLIELNPNFGYNFIGFIDNINDNNKPEKYLGGFNNLEQLIISLGIEEVVIAVPSSEYGNLNGIISVCERNAIRTHIIPDFSQFLSKKFLLNMVEDFPVITMRNEPLLEFQSRFIKRSFDITFSLLASVLILSWLTPLLALLIKMSSPGPIFFLQKRIGLKNKEFNCYKFRSMYFANQKEKFDPAKENDSRITRIGNLLRKTNLDELPQIWNVLKGDMSIVGPRPHPIKFHEVYIKYFEAIKLRHLVKPGLTGWAQVHGLRGDVTDPEENKKRTVKRIKHDLWYIENWSFGLDIQIVLLTIWHMSRGKNTGI